jgi:hypothetical protein
MTISYPFLSTNMDMERQINMCLFMSMKFILIEIKFDIDIDSDEFLLIIWKHNKFLKNHRWYYVATRSPSFFHDT